MKPKPQGVLSRTTKALELPRKDYSSDVDSPLLKLAPEASLGLETLASSSVAGALASVQS